MWILTVTSGDSINQLVITFRLLFDSLENGSFSVSLIAVAMFFNSSFGNDWPYSYFDVLLFEHLIIYKTICFNLNLVYEKKFYLLPIKFV